MKKRIAGILGILLFLAPMATEASFHEPLEAETLYGCCEEAGRMYGISPEFLMAVAQRESSGIPNAENGSCKGLMQVDTRFHSERMARLGVGDIYDPYGNVLVATDYFAELFEEYGDPAFVLDVYNGNSAAEYNYKNGIVSSYAGWILERSAELEREHGK